MRFPLVSIPARTAVWPLGSTPSSTTPPLLRFANALTIPSDDEYGLAIVGEGEGRRRLIQVRTFRRYPIKAEPSSRLYCQSTDSIRNLTHQVSSPTHTTGRNKPSSRTRQPQKDPRPSDISLSQNHLRRVNSQIIRLGTARCRRKTRIRFFSFSKNLCIRHQQMKRSPP